MNRSLFRIVAFALVAAAFAALPAAAQVLPAGPDRWRTPADGNTFFTFPGGDVESLCGAAPDPSWDHGVTLTGVPVAGADWDTEVTRLGDVSLAGGAVPIRVTFLHFRSVAPQATPCGELAWDVRLAGPQPVTTMKIRRTSNLGGTFAATISVRVAFHAFDAAGNFIGSLFYTQDLPDPGGSPWSLGGPTGWRPGIEPDDDCFEILRKKIGTLPAQHAYFIEDLIAQGLCDGRPQ